MLMSFWQLTDIKMTIGGFMNKLERQVNAIFKKVQELPSSSPEWKRLIKILSAKNTRWSWKLKTRHGFLQSWQPHRVTG